MVGAVQRQPAEIRFAAELDRLAAGDTGPRPPGWRLSPRAVRAFVTGDEARGIERKFWGDDGLVDRCIVSLMGLQGLLLAGEPGTAKSMLSELLAAAISGTSRLAVQGSAGVTEDHLRYGWNYALLLAQGPVPAAMVASPVMTAMREGRIVRIEELTRCAPEVQDTLISILSERTLAVPELGADTEFRAAPGFNLIATANLRDRGVHEMSGALKRRFNFETVEPIRDAAFERALIARQLAERLADHPGLPAPAPEVLDVLVAVFRDLRTGRTADGASVVPLSGVMSTAEAVNTAHAASLAAAYLDGRPMDAAHIAGQLRGVALKDDPEDAKRLRAYVDQIARPRARTSRAWAAFCAGA